MDDRTRELVSVAASVAAGCQDCLRQHVAAARRLGVTTDQLHATIDIARAVRLTVSLGMDAFSDAALQDGELAVVSAGCGCGPDCGCRKEA
jgi:AhpD family alkylhydroperoxidase